MTETSEDTRRQEAYDMAETDDRDQDTRQPFILAIISGKGGVGKSMTSVNTAEMLTEMGYKTALIDVDIGLSNCATLLNEPPGDSVSQWIQGECCLEDLPQNCNGITLITGSDEPGENPFQADLLLDAMDQVLNYLTDMHDFIIIDTPAGVGDMTLWALEKAHLGTAVLMDEPTSISDVYRLCKYVYSIDPGYPFACIVNRAKNEESARSTYKRFNTILNYFLQQQTTYLGFIPASQTVLDAIQQQRPVMRLNPDDPVLEEFQFISENLVGYAKRFLIKNHEIRTC